jgi:glutathione S-transferase
VRHGTLEEAKTMKLYMNPMSPNVRRVRLTAAVVGVELEEKTLDFAKGEHKTPDYLALNPNGAVPTLVEGDFVLTESRAIMQYIASKKPEAGLLPRDEKARADVTRWQFWDSSHFSPPLGTLFFQKFVKPMIGMGEPDSWRIEEALTNFRRFGAVLNQRLDGRQYVVGASLTVADLSLASSLMYAEQTEAPLSEFPSVQAWFSRISEMDGWKKTKP